jgi:hypothetical protein
MKRASIAAAAAIFIAIVPVSGACAQTAADPSAEKCRVQPPPTEDQGASGQAPQPPLAETLDDCNGVLKPPAIDDGGMVQQPPAQGRTPVIPPPALPEQQPPAAE